MVLFPEDVLLPEDEFPDPLPTAASMASASPSAIMSNLESNKVLSFLLLINPFSNSTAGIVVPFSTANSVRIFVPRFLKPMLAMFLFAASAHNLALPLFAYTSVS